MGQTYSFWPILPKSGIHACIKLFGILGGGGTVSPLPRPLPSTPMVVVDAMV